MASSEAERIVEMNPKLREVLEKSASALLAGYAFVGVMFALSLCMFLLGFAEYQEPTWRSSFTAIFAPWLVAAGFFVYETATLAFKKGKK